MDPRSPTTAYEAERQRRMAENERRLAALGVHDTVKEVADAYRPQPKTRACKPRVPKHKRPRPENVRRSLRVAGAGPELSTFVDDPERLTLSDLEEEVAAGGGDTTLPFAFEGGLKDLLADDGEAEGDAKVLSVWKEERRQVFQETRCGSLGRGSIYDSAVGITCHFCRQKKLCGEEGCPRCSRRDAQADCIGKTECSRCCGATGRFCRACLLIRYGQTLEDVRAEMAAGTWLCPHCYEEEHPHEGWMCNSSICMKRRGFKPTGIAIYDAQQRGFSSVAHWLQAQIKRCGVDAAVAGDDAEPPASPAAATAAAEQEEEAPLPISREASVEPPATTAPTTPGVWAAGRTRSRRATAALAGGKENCSSGRDPSSAPALLATGGGRKHGGGGERAEGATPKRKRALHACGAGGADGENLLDVPLARRRVRSAVA